MRLSEPELNQPVIQVLTNEKRMEIVQKYSEMTFPISKWHEYSN